jgi:hypothetical protein
MVKWKDSDPSESYDSSPITQQYYHLTITKVRGENGWETKPYSFGDRVLGFEDGNAVLMTSREVVYLTLETDDGEQVSMSLENPVGYMGDPNTIAILETIAPGEFDITKTDEWPDQMQSLVGRKLFAFVATNRWVRVYKALAPAGKYNAKVFSFGFQDENGVPAAGIRKNKNFENSYSHQFPILYQITDGLYKGVVLVNPFGRYPVKRVESNGEVWLTWGNPKHKTHSEWIAFCQTLLGIDLEELTETGVFNFVEEDENEYPNVLPILKEAMKEIPLRLSVNERGFAENVMPNFGGVASVALTPRQKMFAAINDVGQRIYGKDILSMDGEKLYADGLSDLTQVIIGPLCDEFDIFNRNKFLRGGDWDKPEVATPMTRILEDERMTAALEDEEPDVAWAFDAVREYLEAETGI